MYFNDLLFTDIYSEFSTNGITTHTDLPLDSKLEPSYETSFEIKVSFKNSM